MRLLMGQHVGGGHGIQIGWQINLRTENTEDRGVNVYPNPRVQKALRDTMKQLCGQLHNYKSINELPQETICVLEFIGKIYDGLCEKKRKEVING